MNKERPTGEIPDGCVLAVLLVVGVLTTCFLAFVILKDHKERADALEQDIQRLECLHYPKWEQCK